MSQRVLILGASGFIGSHLAAAFRRAGWEVRAGARDPRAACRQAPLHSWVRADFAELTDPSGWRALLEGVDLVVNCVGVLQKGASEDPELAHISGPAALIEACQAAGVRRLIHLSAAGAEAGAGTAYGRTKATTEDMIAGSDLDWIIVRPSLVMARACFGGTVLMRGLAAFPGVIPVLGGDQTFRPLAMSDLADVVLAMADADAPVRVTLDVGGPELVSQSDLLRALRGWLGLAPAPVVPIPSWLAWPAVNIGDLLGFLGWPSAFRSAAVRQMHHGASGPAPDRVTRITGVQPRALAALLADEPATTADRWQARLYFVRPIAIVTLGLFWILTGVITLGPSFDVARQHLRTAGLSDGAAWHGAAWGGVFDILIGLALWVRRWTRGAALAMVLATLGYLVAATIWAPQLWLDPLGPWLKVVPMMVLCLFVAATDDRR